MTDVNIPQDILHKIFNLGGHKKSLYCKKCKKYTDHVSISYAELKHIAESKSKWEKIFMRAMDLWPLSFTLTLGNPYACMTCGRQQFSGGVGSDL